MTIISSEHKNKIQFFRNILPCPWILKMVRRNKRFNSPDIRKEIQIQFLGSTVLPKMRHLMANLLQILGLN